MSEEVALADLRDKVDRIHRIKRMKSRFEERMKRVNALQSGLEKEVVATLEAAGLDSFKGADAQVSITHYQNFQTPKALADQRALGEFLSAQGPEVYYRYMKVASQSLQTLAKEEMAAAVDRGEYDFKIPGLGEPTLSTRLNVRKKG